MVHFAEINQAPPPCSMLQYIGRVATPKPVPRDCLRYLLTTLIMGEGDWSQNLCEVLWFVKSIFVKITADLLLISKTSASSKQNCDLLFSTNFSVSLKKEGFSHQNFSLARSLFKRFLVI